MTRINLTFIFRPYGASFNLCFNSNYFFSAYAVTADKIQLDLYVAYIASFDLNGGEGIAPDSQPAAFGALLTAVADPTRSGYTFKGWNRAIDGSGST